MHIHFEYFRYASYEQAIYIFSVLFVYYLYWVLNAEHFNNFCVSWERGLSTHLKEKGKDLLMQKKKRLSLYYE
jgi:hypothetical protein